MPRKHPPTKGCQQPGHGEVIGRGEKAPTPTLSALLRKSPLLLRADFVLIKDPKWPYEGQFCDKQTGRRGLVVKRPGLYRKDEIRS